MLLGLCAGIGCTAMVHAQGVYTVEITWNGTVAISTSNTDTSATYSWYLEGFLCDNLVGTGPLLRDGTNFWYDFRLTQTFGTPCPQYIADMKTPVDLGTLAPGVYNLYTTSWGEPVMTNTFTIAPTLQSCGFDTNGCFKILLSCGVTNVNYVLQCSTDMVHWVPVSTNTCSANAAGMPLANNYPLSPGVCFYRVACQ